MWICDDTFTSKCYRFEKKNLIFNPVNTCAVAKFQRGTDRTETRRNVQEKTKCLPEDGAVSLRICMCIFECVLGGRGRGGGGVGDGEGREDG